MAGSLMIEIWKLLEKKRISTGGVHCDDWGCKWMLREWTSPGDEAWDSWKSTISYFWRGNFEVVNMLHNSFIFVENCS